MQSCTIFQFERFWLDFESSPPCWGFWNFPNASCSRDDEWYEESQWKVRKVVGLAALANSLGVKHPRRIFWGQVLKPSFFFWVPWIQRDRADVYFQGFITVYILILDTILFPVGHEPGFTYPFATAKFSLAFRSCIMLYHVVSTISIFMRRMLHRRLQNWCRFP